VGARGLRGPRRVVAARLRFLGDRDHLAAGERGEGEDDAELAHGVLDSMGWAITSPEYTPPVLRCPRSVGDFADRRSADAMLNHGGRPSAMRRGANLGGVVALVGVLCAFVSSSLAASIPSDVKKAVAFVFLSDDRGRTRSRPERAPDSAGDRLPGRRPERPRP